MVGRFNSCKVVSEGFCTLVILAVWKFWMEWKNRVFNYKVRVSPVPLSPATVPQGELEVTAAPAPLPLVPPLLWWLRGHWRERETERFSHLAV